MDASAGWWGEEGDKGAKSLEEEREGEESGLLPALPPEEATPGLPLSSASKDFSLDFPRDEDKEEDEEDEDKDEDESTDALGEDWGEELGVFGGGWTGRRGGDGFWKKL